MMKKAMAGFTLAEVLTTLMVIGVVAAMTIPTLMNSTNDQQYKVAYKKAMSVLGQGTQLMVAKEDECTVRNNHDLAVCMNKVISGTIMSPGDANNKPTADGGGNVISTSDGMAYAFYFGGTATDNERSLNDICGDSRTEFGTTAASFNGSQAKCMVVVDVNGASKGTKYFKMGGGSNAKWSSAALTDSNFSDDQQALLLTGTGVRPMYADSTYLKKGYEYMYGTGATPFSN